MNFDTLEKAINFLFKRTTWLMLIWGNLIASLLCMVAMQEMQNLLAGSLSENYCSIFWKISAVLIKVNNSILNFIGFGFIIWSIVEAIPRRILGVDMAQKILNSGIVTNIYLICMLIYIMVGNVVISCSFFIAFFFQDLQLLQSILSFEGPAFSFQHPFGFFTWFPVLIGAWCVISSFNLKEIKN